MDSIQDSLIVLELAESVRLRIENGKFYAALKVTFRAWYGQLYVVRSLNFDNHRFWIVYKINT